MKKHTRLENKSVLKRLSLSLCLVFILGLAPLYAQDQPANGPWSLEDCIQYALKNNVTVRQNDLQVQINENNFLQARISRLPNANANASQQFAWGRSIDPFSNSFVNQRVNSNNFSISSSLTVFDGFRINNTIKQNQKAIESSRANAQQSRNDVSLNVAIAYLNILLNQELLEVAQQNVVATERQLERTQKLFDAGAIAENDVIDLKATLANNQLNVVTAENQVRVSKANIQQFMNIPVREDFEVQTVPIESLNVEDFAETSNQIYETAEVTQPSVRGADLNAESADYAIDVARAGYYPTLTLDAVAFTGFSSATNRSFPRTISGIDTVGFVGGDVNQPVTTEFSTIRFVQDDEYPFLDQLSDNFRQQVTLRLSIPIFNRWQVKNNVSNSIINKQIADLDAQNIRNNLRQTIEQAYVDAKSAIQTYQAREQQVAALQLSFETTEKRYNAGAANIVDYNLARINLDNAKSDLVRAKYDYLFRRKVLDFYMGKELSFN